MNFFRKRWFWAVALSILAYFFIFHRLDVMATHTWDESLFATRAFYIAHEGEYFTNWKDIDHCELDHPNTKPPLTTIVQAASFRIFGYNRWALRFPIAVLGLLTGMLLIFLGKKTSNEYTLGILAFLTLFTAAGYNHQHILRSGDHDASLAFWLLLSLASFLGYQFGKRKNLYIILFFVFTGCGILTKSIMGFFMLPGVAVYALFFTPVMRLLKNPWFYAGILVMIVQVSLFYGIMEINHPGFIQLVWDNEIGGRYASAIDNHIGPWYYYLKYFGGEGFDPFWVPTLAGIWFGLSSKNSKLRHTSLLLIISGAIFLTVLSVAHTKLQWYAAPLYPIMAFLTAVGLIGIADQILWPLLLKIKGVRWRREWIWVAFALFFLSPIYKTLKRNTSETTKHVVERYELYLEKLHEMHPEIKQLKVHTNNEYYPTLVFLGNKFDKLYDVQLDVVTSKNELFPGDTLFGAYHPRMKPLKMTEIESFGSGDVKLWRIDSTN